MTTPQAKHNAKRRSEGAAVIAVEFRAEEPEAQVWKELVQWFGSPKKAMSELIKQALAEYKRMLGNKTTFGIDKRHVESIISRAETDAEKIARLEDELAKTSRWIKWDGKGEACPVSEITQVVVRHRSGEQSIGYALEFWWFSKDRNCVSSYMVLPS